MPAQSVDRFVLLDAQDWMTDAQLSALWRAITRSASAGARVIFRTAGKETILPGHVDAKILARGDILTPAPSNWADLTALRFTAGFTFMHAANETLPDHSRAMDRMYRFQRHIYDASRHYYLLGRDRLLDRLEPPPGGSILEIGCGTGRNLIGAAHRFKDAKLFGIDISHEMLKTALGAMQRMNFETRVKFACVDATSFDPMLSLAQTRFDRIYFSYTIHGARLESRTAPCA